MRIEARLFELLTGLFILATIVYGVLTKVFSHHLEWAGTTALALTAGLTLIIGTFFRFISRRVDIRPPGPRPLSNTTTSWPRPVRPSAQASPAIPAPTIPTRIPANLLATQVLPNAIRPIHCREELNLPGASRQG